MQVTWLDSNSWLLHLGQHRLLIDPWLVDNLVFGNLPWLFRGKRPQSRPLPEQIDLILLSQGIEDHAHPPTLKQLERHIPVIASPNATKVVQELGYEQIITLNHGESYTFAQQLTITAFPGAFLGPLLQENAYYLHDLTTNHSLYYEPHGYHAPEIQKLAPVNVAIASVINLELPILGPIIQGRNTSLELCQWLQPQFILPTADAGEVQYEGLLTSLLRTVGSYESFRQQLAQSNLPTELKIPQPGKSIQLLSNNK